MGTITIEPVERQKVNSRQRNVQVWQQLQQSFVGVAEEMGLKSEEDAMELMQEVRREKYRQRCEERYAHRD